MSKRIIINADDFGITKGVNKAISELADARVLTSTAVMTNMPYYKDVLALKDKIGIGIHFNLTVGLPVTDTRKIPTLVNEYGYFFELPQLVELVRQRKISKSEAEIELEAQTRRLIEIGIQPDHINSHESFLKYPFFVDIVKKLGKAYDIKAVRTFSQRQFDYTRLLSPRKIMVSIYLAYQKFQYKKEGFHFADKQDSLLKFGLNFKSACKKLGSILNNLPDGVLEIVTHPGYCEEDTIPLGKYVNEREVELKTLLSNFNEITMLPNVKLIRFKDI